MYSLNGCGLDQLSHRFQETPELEAKGGDLVDVLALGYGTVEAQLKDLIG